jgi:hypothetical protein
MRDVRRSEFIGMPLKKVIQSQTIYLRIVFICFIHIDQFIVGKGLHLADTDPAGEKIPGFQGNN